MKGQVFDPRVLSCVPEFTAWLEFFWFVLFQCQHFRRIRSAYVVSCWVFFHCELIVTFLKDCERKCGIFLLIDAYFPQFILPLSVNGIKQYYGQFSIYGTFLL